MASLHRDSTNRLVQISIFSSLAYAIWFTHVRSWLTPGFLSVLNICCVGSRQRALALTDHSVSNAAASPPCLVIAFSLFTAQVSHACLKKALPNLADYI